MAWLFLLLMAGTLIIAAFSAPINNEAGDGIMRFIGRFHVLALHFPAVLLLLAPLFELLSRTQKFRTLKEHVVLIWWLSAISAFVTVALGLTLAANEGFAISEVKTHLLGGLLVALIALFCTGLRTTLTTVNSRLLYNVYSISAVVLVFTTMYAAHAGGNLVHGETYLTRFAPEPIKQLITTQERNIAAITVDDREFTEQVEPLLSQYCFSCHGDDTQKGNVKLNSLNPDMVNGSDAAHWHSALDMLNSGEMPPAKKTQPSKKERNILVEWMTKNIELAKASKANESSYVIRRLTKQQYSNTLQDLLGVNIDFGKTLPDDPISPMGFSNNGELLFSSPLHLEYFQNIARTALNKAITTGEQPQKTHYRVYFGKNKGVGEPYPKATGFVAKPLDTNNFYIEVLDENGKVKTDGNVNQIKKSLTVDLRGSHKSRYIVEDNGLTLFSALPHVEKQPSSWHGPSPNVALLVSKYFPKEGNFIVRVKAEKALNIPESRVSIIEGGKAVATLTKNNHPQKQKNNKILSLSDLTFEELGSLIPDKKYKKGFVNKGKEALLAEFLLTINKEDSNLYQIDLVHTAVRQGKVERVQLVVNGFYNVTTRLRNEKGLHKKGDIVVSPLAVVRLAPNNTYTLSIGGKFSNIAISDVILTPIHNKKMTKKLAPIVFDQQKYANQTPSILPYIGTRTDDGMDYKNFAHSLDVTAAEGKAKIYSFKGRLENFPLPAEGTSGDSIFSGNLKIGLWNNHLVKNINDTGPPLRIEYIEFEAPYYEQWPTKSHKQIFIDSTNKNNPDVYGKEVITHFANKAFRRKLSEDDVAPYIELWQAIKGDFSSFEEGIVESLVGVLSSTNFLFLAEPSDFDQVNIEEEKIALQKKEASGLTLSMLLGVSSADAANNNEHALSDYALASRLSYFLWNSAPDAELLKIAEQGQLKAQLSAQVNRMLKDNKLERFIDVFANEWLNLDRQQRMSVDVDRYPDYTRFVKRDMALETKAFIKEVIRKDLGIDQFIDADFAMLNQNLAEFYGIKGVQGNNFQHVTLKDKNQRGGLLLQGAFLTGHSDGIHGHPVKRAVWFKKKILGENPPPPPPNVPELDPETPGFENLTLKQQLEMHRDKESCRSCHEKIDPYGIVFEKFDAVGRYRDSYKGNPIDAASTLPNGTHVNGIAELKSYVLKNKKDDISRAFIKHLYAYALGKNISFHDDAAIEQLLEQVKKQNYSVHTLFNAIVSSPAFTKAEG